MNHRVNTPSHASIGAWFPVLMVALVMGILCFGLAPLAEAVEPLRQFLDLTGSGSGGNLGEIPTP